MGGGCVHGGAAAQPPDKHDGARSLRQRRVEAQAGHEDPSCCPHASLHCALLAADTQVLCFCYFFFNAVVLISCFSTSLSLMLHCIVHFWLLTRRYFVSATFFLMQLF